MKKMICSVLCAGMMFTGSFVPSYAGNIEINEDDGYCDATDTHSDSFCTYCMPFKERFKEEIEVDDVHVDAYIKLVIEGQMTVCRGNNATINEYDIVLDERGCSAEIRSIKKIDDDRLRVKIRVKGKGSSETRTKTFSAEALVDAVAEGNIVVGKIKTKIKGVSANASINTQLKAAAKIGMDVKVEYYIDGSYTNNITAYIDLDGDGDLSCRFR